MPMKPVSELLALIRGGPAKAFADRFPQQDLLVAENWEKGREYRGRLPVNPAGVYMALPRTANQPVPMGRDVRAVVQLDHAAVSRLHAVLAFTGQGWKVMDRSSNGSWVDEEKLPAQTATAIAYGANLRLGRAMVVRVLTPEGLYDLVARAAPAPAPAPPPQAPPSHADPRAETHRFASVRDSLLQPDRPESNDELEVDFDDPKPKRGAAPTAMTPRPGGGPPPPPKKSDDIEFEFDLDFGDGKGGFA